MRYQHTRCGGEIDVKRRRCLKCKKGWNPISFMVTTNEIRPMVDKKGRVVLNKPVVKPRVTYAPWADKLPGVGKVAGFLPNWPRWARILVTILFILVVVGIIYLIKEVA